MKTKGISGKYARKLNLGDYNSADIEFSAWGELEEGDDLQEELDILFEILRDNVKRRAVPLVEKYDTVENFKQMFRNLPVEMQEVVRKRGVKF